MLIRHNYLYRESASAVILETFYQLLNANTIDIYKCVKRFQRATVVAMTEK